MANEKSLAVTFTASIGGATINTSQLSKTYDMAGTDMATTTIGVTTSAAQITLGAITWGGGVDLVIKNLSTSITDVIIVSSDSGGANVMAKIGGGKVAVLPGIEAAPYLDASAGTIQCQVWVAEL
jgi:hypothetical protein